MKKVLVWLLVAVMALAAIGCGTPAAEEPETTDGGDGTKAAADMKVVALLPGTITDNGWNYICYEALKGIADEYMGGKEPEYIENIAVSDMAGYIRQYGEDGYDLVIIHGAQFEAAAVECAPLYPDTKFCLSYGFKIDGSTDQNIKDIDNLAYVGPVGMGVAIGGIMGILTETDKVVFLGGTDTPAISDIVSGIVPGVKLTNPEATATTEYIGTLTDQDMAREAAKAYIDQGYDVICASANSAQLGCLWAAEDAGVYAIGFNSDQYSIAPDAVVLSVMRNYSMIYKDVFDKLVAGEWQSGKVAYELTEEGTIVSDWHGWDEKLPEEKVTAINEFLEKLFAGEYEGQY